MIARVLRQTLRESLGGRGVDGEKVGGVRRGIYLGEIRRVAVDARPQLVVEDAAYDAFIALEDQQAAGAVVRVDARSAMVEQGLDEGVGLVVVALGCGKIGENIPCSHEIDGGNDAQGQGAEPETAPFDAFPDAAEILPERPEDCRGHEQQADQVAATGAGRILRCCAEGEEQKPESSAGQEHQAGVQARALLPGSLHVRAGRPILPHAALLADGQQHPSQGDAPEEQDDQRPPAARADAEPGIGGGKEGSKTAGRVRIRFDGATQGVDSGGKRHAGCQGQRDEQDMGELF